MSRASLQGRGKCNDLGTGAGFSAVCLRARGQREPSFFKEREARGGLGREMVAGRVSARLGVAGGGGGGVWRALGCAQGDWGLRGAHSSPDRFTAAERGAS